MSNHNTTKTPWIIGAILTTIILIATALIFAPLTFILLVSNSSPSLQSNLGCYSITTTGNTRNDGMTTQPILGPNGYSEEQLNNARIIDQTAAQLGLPGAASIIAITAAFGESTLYNLGYGDEGHGVTNPDGTPTTSKGLFQQQTSMGWGTVEQVTNPTYATTSFFLGPQHKGPGGLVSVKGWETMERTIAIHKVQHNADPLHYARSYANADEIIKIIGVDTNRPADEDKQAAWKNSDFTPTTDNTTTNPINCTNETTIDGETTIVAGKEARNTYPWGEYGDNLGIVTPPGQWTADPMAFYYGECTSFVSWKLNEALGGTKDNIIFHNTYGKTGLRKGNGAEWKTAWEAEGWKISNKPVPGAVAWWGPNGAEGIGTAGHVAYVADVTEDGKAIIEEYNNAYYAPPGHRYNVRPQPVDPTEVNAFLYPPPKLTTT